MDFKINLPDGFSPEDRAERAKNNFLDGYNCCQAVLLAFSDLLEPQVPPQLLAVLGSGFGGGMARMREVCGSFTGAVAMAGFISPADDPSVKPARTANYALVQKMAEEFKELNGGSIVCGELLGLRKRPEMENPEPSDRTPEYYRKRPCPQIIYNAALIVARKLVESQEKVSV